MAAKRKEPPKQAERQRSILLTHQQAQYVEATLDGKTPIQAAAAAGYKNPVATGSVPLRSQVVQQAIREGRDELSSLTQITRADVIDGVMEAINIGRMMSDPTAMIRGWSEIAKMLGYYAPEVKKVELDVKSGNIQAKLRGMTDAELLEIIEGECKEVEDDAS